MSGIRALMPFEAREPLLSIHMISHEELHRVVSDSLKESAALKMRLLELHAGPILEWAKAIAQCIHQGNKLIAFGNGGSAADAQHIAAELVGRYMRDRKALAALALTGNASVLTAIANDYGFEAVFSRQIEALGRSGDIALAISTSGRSRNVILGAQAARKIGIKVLALTGQGHESAFIPTLIQCWMCLQTMLRGFRNAIRQSDMFCARF